MTTITEVIAAFERLFEAMHERRFAKTLGFIEKGEKELLPYIRYYLLGYFDRLEPESKIQIEEYESGLIDFIVDNVAVEFAAKNGRQSRTILQRNHNEKEIKKLMSYSGNSLLVLFDFEKSTSHDYVKNVLEEYRKVPAFHKDEIYPFNVVYFYINEYGEFAKQKVQVRVN